MVSADFASFPTPQMARTLKEGDAGVEVVGRLRLARVEGVQEAPGATVPLIVDFKDLRNIHQTVMG